MNQEEKIVGGIIASITSLLGLLAYFEKWKAAVIKRGIQDNPEIQKLKEKLQQHDIELVGLKSALKNERSSRAELVKQIDEIENKYAATIRDMMQLFKIR